LFMDPPILYIVLVYGPVYIIQCTCLWTCLYYTMYLLMDPSILYNVLVYGPVYIIQCTCLWTRLWLYWYILICAKSSMFQYLGELY